MPKAASSSRRTNPSRRTMKAAAIERFGAPEVLKLHELPVFQPAPNEVLIALQTSGVGVWDADIRKGWWPRGRPESFCVSRGARGRRCDLNCPRFAF
jgi:NADPH:quinone reductase-like Zn-dependent oxidoreductase